MQIDYMLFDKMFFLDVQSCSSLPLDDNQPYQSPLDLSSYVSMTLILSPVRKYAQTALGENPGGCRQEIAD